MAKSTNRDRILKELFLYGNDSVPGRTLMQNLNLSEETFKKEKEGLTEDGLINVGKGAGGVFTLTAKGKKIISSKALPKSTVENEKALYAPFIELLEEKAKEEEGLSVIFDTSGHRKSGQWENPDVMKITRSYYELLNRDSISLISYELKTASGWNRSSVYETAAHAQFAHESYLVIEWPRDVKETENDILNDIVPLATEFGIGVIALKPHYSKFTFNAPLLISKKHNPPLSVVEERLQQILYAEEGRLEEYKKLFPERKGDIQGE